MSLIHELAKKGLLESSKVSALEYERKQSHKKEEEFLLEKGIVSEDVLFQLKSEKLGIPLKEVYPEDVAPEVINIIPEESASHYQMVPLAKKGNTIEVGMVYPEDIRAQEALQFLARENRFDYRVFLITPTTFGNLLQKYRSLRGEVTKALSELETEFVSEEIAEEVSARLERVVEEAPVTKVVSVILRHAVEGRASDIHIEPTRDKTRIRFRVDGVLYSSLFLPLKVHPAVVARVKILANLKIDETRIPQDGRFSVDVGNQNIDIRVSTFPTTMGEKVALRILDPTMGKKTFEELGIVGQNKTILSDALQKPYGMVLATGPTGSGKTTTLYAILNLLNKEGVNIVTIEDPVEYNIEGINQSRVRPEIGYTFANALRSILRQDPDIIMVGEIRDEETAALATHAALTGHIMLSTLHTNNAVGAIPRLIDMGVKPFLIPPTLNVVIAQRLVRRLCPYCKTKQTPPLEIEQLMVEELEAIPSPARKGIKIPSSFKIYLPQGCRKCNYKGYSGRVGIFEILKMTDQLAKIIRENPSKEAFSKEAFRQGMISMRQDGILKVLEGITSLEEVLRVTGEEYVE